MTAPSGATAATLDDAVPSRKEGWTALADAIARTPPDRLDPDALGGLSEQAKADYDRQRRIWHANIGPLRTPQMVDIHEDLWDILDSNAHDGDKVKGAAAIDAFPAWARPPSR
jgi:hypothetical protein